MLESKLSVEPLGSSTRTCVEEIHTQEASLVVSKGRVAFVGPWPGGLLGPVRLGALNSGVERGRKARPIVTICISVACVERGVIGPGQVKRLRAAVSHQCGAGVLAEGAMR